MDHSHGLQAEPIPLPLASTLSAPSLILMLKHPSVDTRLVHQHIKDLHGGLESTLPFAPSFREIDLSRGSVDTVRDVLLRTVRTARESMRHQFVFSPLFAPRYALFAEHAERIYTYLPGPTPAEALLGVYAVRGVDVKSLPVQDAYVRLVRRAAPALEPAPEDVNEMVITVSGKARTGRSAVSGLIARALRDKWPHIRVVWDDPDGAQGLIEANLDAGQYQNIDTQVFTIRNTTKIKASHER